MECRLKSYGPGARLPVKHCASAYPLPEGLPEGTIVTVTGSDIGRTKVRTDDGREWNLPMQCVEAGMECLIGNRWLDETDPRAKAALKQPRPGSAYQPTAEGLSTGTSRHAEFE